MRLVVLYLAFVDALVPPGGPPRTPAPATSRRALLGTGAALGALVSSPAFGKAAPPSPAGGIDWESLGISRKDLGLPPAPPVDPKAAAKAKAEQQRQAKVAAAEAQKLERAQAASDRKAAEGERKAALDAERAKSRAALADAKIKERTLKDLGLDAKSLGLESSKGPKQKVQLVAPKKPAQFRTLAEEKAYDASLKRFNKQKADVKKREAAARKVQSERNKRLAAEKKRNAAPVLKAAKEKKALSKQYAEAAKRAEKAAADAKYLADRDAQERQAARLTVQA